jgi:hypothetical protein
MPPKPGATGATTPSRANRKPRQRRPSRAKRTEADKALPLALRKVDAAAQLGISRWHLDKLIAQGVIGTVQLGTVTVIPLSELERVLAVGLRREQQ